MGYSKVYNKREAKRALLSIKQKAFKLTQPVAGNPGLAGYMTPKDFMTINAIIERTVKKNNM